MSDVRPLTRETALSTKNSTVSQVVLFAAFAMSLLGLIVDQSKTLVAIGLILFSMGMGQSYFGTVFEIQRSKRFWFLILGVPLAVGLASVSLLHLNDFASSSKHGLTVLAAAVALQIMLSWTAVTTWNWLRVSRSELDG